MTNIVAIIIGSLVGLAINLGAVYYFVKNTRKKTKNTALSVILSVVLGPLVGFAYARPKAWGAGLAVLVLFAAPIAGASVASISAGNVLGATVMIVYGVISTAVTAVFMTQDQNEQFGGSTTDS